MALSFSTWPTRLPEPEDNWLNAFSGHLLALPSALPISSILVRNPTNLSYSKPARRAMSWACLFCFSSFHRLATVFIVWRLEGDQYDLSFKCILVQIWSWVSAAPKRVQSEWRAKQSQEHWSARLRNSPSREFIHMFFEDCRCLECLFFKGLIVVPIDVISGEDTFESTTMARSSGRRRWHRGVGGQTLLHENSSPLTKPDASVFVRGWISQSPVFLNPLRAVVRLRASSLNLACACCKLPRNSFRDACWLTSFS